MGANAMKYILIFLIAISFNSFGKDLKETINYDSFEKAKNGKSQLKFIVESTKAGLFSSDVDGYVKEFDYSAKLDEKNMIMTDMVISFAVEKMDTDNESRDTKLHDLCMSAKEFPRVEVRVPGPLFLKEARPHKYQGVVIIRGNERPFEIELSQNLEGNKMIITGHSVWGLKSMGIPDPSIMVAKLSDEIRIHIKIAETL